MKNKNIGIIAAIGAGILGLLIGIVLFTQILINQEKEKNDKSEQATLMERIEELEENGEDIVKLKIGKIENIENFNINKTTADD